MSQALYDLGGLRFWTQREILIREQAIASLTNALTTALTALNPAWSFHRLDGPTLTPGRYIDVSYDEDDVFTLKAKLGEDDAALRPETTASSYLYAKHLMQSGQARMPLCVWQAGKSYRRETTDGARASTLRYNEFYQLEYQCIFAGNTKADIGRCVIDAVKPEIGRITRSITRVTESDRLPAYSAQTIDIECVRADDWKEMASISHRLDFPYENSRVVEVAIGLDRLVAVEEEHSDHKPNTPTAA